MEQLYKKLSERKFSNFLPETGAVFYIIERPTHALSHFILPNNSASYEKVPIL